MHLIFVDCDSWSLNAEIASYSFQHTAPEGALRLFVIDLILGNGLFREKSDLTEKRDGVEMLGSGGEGEGIGISVMIGSRRGGGVEEVS
jgi:hypothetical protein